MRTVTVVWEKDQHPFQLTRTTLRSEILFATMMCLGVSVKAAASLLEGVSPDAFGAFAHGASMSLPDATTMISFRSRVGQSMSMWEAACVVNSQIQPGAVCLGRCK